MRSNLKSIKKLNRGYMLVSTVVIALVAASAYFLFVGKTATADSVMSVYKDPNCGCCGDWVDHIESQGFIAKIQHSDNLNAIKEELGVLPSFQSCHTGVYKEYVFEGHIPADVMQTFLLEKPLDAIGLAVPGMPLGSPGMDVEGEFRPYQVLQLNKDGSSRLYAEVSIDKTVYSEKGL